MMNSTPSRFRISATAADTFIAPLQSGCDSVHRPGGAFRGNRGSARVVRLHGVLVRRLLHEIMAGGGGGPRGRGGYSSSGRSAVGWSGYGGDASSIRGQPPQLLRSVS